MQNKLAVWVLICSLPLTPWVYGDDMPQQVRSTALPLIVEGTQLEEEELQQILTILHGVGPSSA